MTFDALQNKYADRDAAFPPDWDKPNMEDLNFIQSTYSCKFPPSFILFQTDFCHSVSMGDFSFEGFGWANRKLEPYLNLEEVVRSYRALNFPAYLSPFRIDNGDFWCFDTRHADQNAEFRVVVWSHNDNAIEKDMLYQWENFIDWLDKTMENEG